MDIQLEGLVIKWSGKFYTVTEMHITNGEFACKYTPINPVFEAALRDNIMRDPRNKIAHVKDSMTGYCWFDDDETKGELPPE